MDGNAKDRVQQGNVRRVARVVDRRVVMTEHQVFQERAVSMLHAEVALFDHEVDEPLVDVGHFVGRDEVRVRRLDFDHCRVAPEDVFSELVFHKEPWQRAFEATEDRAAHVKVLHARHSNPTRMVVGTAGGQGCFSLQI